MQIAIINCSKRTGADRKRTHVAVEWIQAVYVPHDKSLLKILCVVYFLINYNCNHEIHVKINLKTSNV